MERSEMIFCAREDETDLKRLMKSNISSLETSGYFFCSLRASMMDVDGDLGLSMISSYRSLDCGSAIYCAP